MQLVAYGAQDIYLTGNPQITFFKVVYRRHTNFSMECIEQTINGTIAATSSSVTSTISRNGDLVNNMHLEVKFAAGITGTSGDTSLQWVNNTGHALVKDVEIEIGGQRIDKHYGHWLDIWNEMSDPHGEQHSLLNKHAAKNAYLKSGSATALCGALRTYTPLSFFFCRTR